MIGMVVQLGGGGGFTVVVDEVVEPGEGRVVDVVDDGGDGGRWV